MKAKRTGEEVTFARRQGRSLYELRNRRRMTRAQVSRESGVNYWALYRIEMGDTTATAYQLAALSRALNTPHEYFFPAIDARERLYA